MPSTEILLAFTAAALMLSLSPGPSNLYVMARTIAQGKHGGMVAAVGLATGGMLHAIAAMLGLSALFTYSPLLYTLVKLLGAGYLIYLGVRYWRSPPPQNTEGVPQATHKPLWSVFWESIIVEVSNPKTALFFLALLPQFVVPDAGPVPQQLLVLGLIVTLCGLVCDLLVVALASKVSAYLLNHRGAQQLQERISAAILVAMGAYIALEEARSLHQ